MWVAFATAAAPVRPPGRLMMPRVWPRCSGNADDTRADSGTAGWRIIRYQRNMRKLPTYRLRAKPDSLSRRKLFLGKGLSLDPATRPTVARYDSPEVQRYVQPGRLHRWARPQGGGLGSTPILQWLARLLHASLVESLAPLPAVGGKPALHAVEPDEQSVWMDIGERVGHTLVLGTTRVNRRAWPDAHHPDIRRGDV